MYGKISLDINFGVKKLVKSFTPKKIAILKKVTFSEYMSGI